jgi:hypothetical protein
MKKILFSALIFLGYLSSAIGQTPPSGLTPCASASLSVSGTTSNTQLSTCGPTVLLINITSQEAFYNLGAASNTAATTSNYSLPGNTSVVLNVGQAGLYLAAITATSTATLRIVQGWGYTQLGS